MIDSYTYLWLCVFGKTHSTGLLACTSMHEAEHTPATDMTIAFIPGSGEQPQREAA